MTENKKDMYVEKHKSREKERRFLIELIHLYRSLPALYDKKHEDYNDRIKKEPLHNKLLKKYREYYTNAKKDDVLRKIHVLRTNFMRELKRLEELDIQEPEKSPHLSHLWYFKAMSFIKDIIRGTDSSNNNRNELNTIQWTEDDILLLIELYEDEPILYDKTHPHYRYKSDVNNSLQNIAVAFMDKYPQITINDVREKIRFLRNKYFAKRQNCMKNYSTMPYWFEKLSFLEDKYSVNNTASSTTQSFNSDEESLDIEPKRKQAKYNESLADLDEAIELLSEESLNKEDKYNESTNDCLEYIEAVDLQEMQTDDMKLMKEDDSVTDTTMNKQKYSNHIEVFGEFIKAEMARIPEDQQINIRRRILEVLMNMNNINDEKTNLNDERFNRTMALEERKMALEEHKVQIEEHKMKMDEQRLKNEYHLKRMQLDIKEKMFKYETDLKYDKK